MGQDPKAVAKAFFAAMEAGSLPDALFTEDFTGWTCTSGTADRARYLGGVPVFLRLFPDGITYTVDAMTSEEDRVACEVRGTGTLVNGEAYAQDYIFLIRVRGDQVASVREFFNPLNTMDKIAPLIAEMIQR